MTVTEILQSAQNKDEEFDLLLNIKSAESKKFLTLR